MNTIDAKILKPGLVFSAPVFVEDGNMLVPARVPLRQKDIDLLTTWDIETVETEGGIINDRDEGIEKDKEIEIEVEKELPPPLRTDSILPKLKQESVKFSISQVQDNTGPYRAYISLIEKLDLIFIAIADRLDVEIRNIDNICAQLLQELRDHRESFIDFILGGEVSGHDLAKSSLNTAILSTLTAQELKLAHHKVLHIVMGALLHDVGMLRLPKGVLDKKGGLSDAELELVKSHTGHTSKIVTKELFCAQEVNLIALHHHERWDGRGYPEHILGPDIDIGARIVSVADAFEAMVSKKSYRNSMMGYQAMKNLLADNSRRFDPGVIRAFSKVMGIYPIGSIVLLNSGLLARVIKVHADAPLRPVIQMLLDEFGKVLKPDQGEIIDLLTEKTLYIKNAIDPKDFSGADA